MSQPDTLMWEAFGNSPTAHLVDHSKAAPRRSGPRALCGRYPGRNHHAWWSMPIQAVANGPLSYDLKRCLDCLGGQP